MLSPFPGMDPYLEAPGIWPDLHNALASEIRVERNRALPAPYYARLEMRPEVGTVEEGLSRRRIVPDLVVMRPPRRRVDPGPGGAGAAVLNRPRRDLSESIEVEERALDEPPRHPFVEIRDSLSGHKLITLIEILSPSNKRPGPDRDSYQARQVEVLGSDASLIEIDLLRGGQRLLSDPKVAAQVAQLDPPADYLVLVSRAWKRGAGGGGHSVFPCLLRDWLPCLPVPLKDGEPEIPLDLQFVFNRAYEGGPYLRGAVHYGLPPDPPLPPDAAAWADALLRGRGLRAGPGGATAK